MLRPICLRRRGRVRVTLGAVGWLVAALLMGCARSADDCTCEAQNSGVRRTLACGETVCIGGLSVACVDNAHTVERGACAETPATAATAPLPPPSVVAPVDTSCDDLRTFCATSCSRPANASADCQSTANTGDAEGCATWQLTSGVLCRP